MTLKELNALIHEIQVSQDICAKILMAAIAHIQSQIAKNIQPKAEFGFPASYPNEITLNKLKYEDEDIDLTKVPRLLECRVCLTDRCPITLSKGKLFLITEQRLGSGGHGPVYLAIEIQHSWQAHVYLLFSHFFKVKELSFSTQNDKTQQPPTTNVIKLLYQDSQNVFIQTRYHNRVRNEKEEQWFFDYLEGTPLNNWIKDTPLQTQDFESALESMCRISFDVIIANLGDYLLKDIKPANIIIGEDNKISWIDIEGARHYLTDPSQDPFGLTPSYGSPTNSISPRKGKPQKSLARIKSAELISIIPSAQQVLWKNIWKEYKESRLAYDDLTTLFHQLNSIDTKLPDYRDETYSLAVTFVIILYGNKWDKTTQDKLQQLHPETFLSQLNSRQKSDCATHFLKYVFENEPYKSTLDSHKLVDILLAALQVDNEERIGTVTLFSQLAKLYFFKKNITSFPIGFFTPLKPRKSGYKDMLAIGFKKHSFMWSACQGNDILY